MDPRRFDALTRAVAAGSTRRGILAALAALPLGGLLTTLNADEAAAERPRDRLRRRHQQRNRKRRNQRRRKHNNNKNTNGGKGGANLGSCTANGGACNQNRDCCQGNCFNQVCSNTVNQCGGADCPPGATGCCPADGCCGSPANQCNDAELCCAPNCDDRECGPDGCGNTGTCGSCQNGQTCNAQTGQCCNAQTCPNGCCDASGACQPGNIPLACGTDGFACDTCLPGQTCSAAGACEGQPICNEEVCPLGCCDDDSICQSGRNASFCGTRGEACVTCLPEQFCNSVTRQCSNEPGCNENTCDGCCDEAGTCQPGTAKMACGTGGVNCANCRGAAAICENGQCLCTPDCTGIRCGSDGCAGTCGTCAPNQTCTNGVCELKCTTRNCPNGCCDATGTCQPGNTNEACGVFTANCQVCEGSCQGCFNGACAQVCDCGGQGCPGETTCDGGAGFCCVEDFGEAGTCSATMPCCIGRCQQSPPAVNSCCRPSGFSCRSDAPQQCCSFVCNANGQCQ